VNPVPLHEVKLDEGSLRRSSGIDELDRVLGGGLVDGSLTLIGGDPGVGKSTLMLLLFGRYAGTGSPALYVSGEESARQVRLRADRLGVRGEGLHLLADTDLDAALAAAEKMRPRLVILDSVQTLHSPAVDGIPGAVNQVRLVAARSMAFAKSTGIPVFLVGHVTKSGGIAGPKVLEHLVDTVIYFQGENQSQLRVLRATKNRFGSTGELGFFEMTEKGLEQVPDASARLLAERSTSSAGTAVVCALEGSRPLLVEVQSLVGRPTPATPGRTVLGLDKGRLNMLLAVLGKHGHALHDRDVFVSAAGGVRVHEPAVDLGIAAAVLSSLQDRPVDPHTLLFGEVGLVGEVRAVTQPGPRLVEAHRYGFRRVICPANSLEHAPKGLEVIGVRSLSEAIQALFSTPRRTKESAAASAQLPF
jgi:DNA repair protein RadA/Sms